MRSWTICFAAIVLLLFTGEFKVLLAADAAAPAALVFSEMTIDTPPGAEGSWIEFYNPGNSDFAAKDVTLIYNKQSVFTFPDMAVPAKALILVRFTSDPIVPLMLRSKTLSADNVAVLTVPPKFAWEKFKAPENRKPGYCALFRSREPAEETIMDYVSWGDYMRNKRADKEHNLWAAKAHIWLKEAQVVVSSASDALMPGESSLVVAGVLVRSDFTGHIPLHHIDNWLLCPESDSTPGAGNTWPPPYVSSPKRGEGISKDEGVTLSWDSRTPQPPVPLPPNLRPAHVQIATDPHFRTVVLDDHFQNPTTLNANALKPGRYYARMKVEFGSFNTDWSPPVFFKYHLPPAPETPAKALEAAPKDKAGAPAPQAPKPPEEKPKNKAGSP